MKRVLAGDVRGVEAKLLDGTARVNAAPRPCGALGAAYSFFGGAEVEASGCAGTCAARPDAARLLQSLKR